MGDRLTNLSSSDSDIYELPSPIMNIGDIYSSVGSERTTSRTAPPCGRVVQNVDPSLQICLIEASPTSKLPHWNSL